MSSLVYLSEELLLLLFLWTRAATKEVQIPCWRDEERDPIGRERSLDCLERNEEPSQREKIGLYTYDPSQDVIGSLAQGATLT